LKGIRRFVETDDHDDHDVDDHDDDHDGDDDDDEHDDVDDDDDYDNDERTFAMYKLFFSKSMMMNCAIHELRNS
jgi:hypothetical protein